MYQILATLFILFITTIIFLILVATNIGLFAGRNHFPVDGKTILVTGGSQGTGKAVASILAQKGANVFIVARDPAKLQAALTSIRADARNPEEQKFHYISCDLAATPDAGKEVIAAATALNGGLPPDSVICCAGAARPGYFLNVPTEELSSQMTLNYLAAANLAHAACHAWLTPADTKTEAHRGDSSRKVEVRESPLSKTHHITFISSLLAFLPLTGYAAYTPTKVALRALSETLSQELKLYEASGTFIRSHCIFPGTVFTPGFDQEQLLKPDLTKLLEEGDAGQTPEAVAKSIIWSLERGEENATTGGIVPRLLKAGMLGGSRRSGWIFEAAAEWVVTCFVSIVLIFVRKDLDMKVKRFSRRHALDVKVVRP